MDVDAGFDALPVEEEEDVDAGFDALPVEADVDAGFDALPVEADVDAGFDALPAGPVAAEPLRRFEGERWQGAEHMFWLSNLPVFRVGVRVRVKWGVVKWGVKVYVNYI
jgi:hypothetical protein